MHSIKCRVMCKWFVNSNWLSQSLIGQINRVEFCPTNERFIASSCSDRAILVWDLCAIGTNNTENNYWIILFLGKEQTPDDAHDGPPELLVMTVYSSRRLFILQFTHIGHSGVVNDLGWNPSSGFEEVRHEQVLKFQY